MAEGGYCNNPSSRRRPRTQLCKYFMHGACDKGDSCRFLHDKTGAAPSNNVCKFYQRGQCSYGSGCRYDHVRASQGPTPSRQNADNDTRLRQRHRKPSSSDNSNSAPNPGGGQNDVFWNSSLVTLKKDGNPHKDASVEKKSQEQHKTRNLRARAQDFIPGQKFHAGASYARATQTSDDEKAQNRPNDSGGPGKEQDLLCPYFAHGDCPYGLSCNYLHGDICDICQFPRLHPHDKIQREAHTKECMAEMEKDMEHSFAVKESEDKECCICLELVLEKAGKETTAIAAKGPTPRDQLFGILENCKHCFCLLCIRKWRGEKCFGKNARVCPICRVHSDFVTPSNVWVEDEEKKKKVIHDYKAALSIKPCQYFKKGKGNCPFNEKCFYRHAYPDGTIAEPKPRKPRRRVDADGESEVMQSISLWDYLEVREDGLISLEDELSLYLLEMLQDSDDDDFDFLYGDISDSDSDFYI